MKSIHVATLAAALALASCATEKTLEATGGSRADGTVELSYEYGAFQRPVVNMTAAEVTATDRCKAWGYGSAQPFGGQINHCNQYNAYGCIDMLVTIKYQCTGGGFR